MCFHFKLPILLRDKFQFVLHKLTSSPIRCIIVNFNSDKFDVNPCVSVFNVKLEFFFNN